jgi:hypothetical protein
VALDAQGRVDIGDALPVPNAAPRVLAERAAALLASPPAMQPYRGQTLAGMQAATLAVYAELVDV